MQLGYSINRTYEIAPTNKKQGDVLCIKRKITRKNEDAQSCQHCSHNNRLKYANQINEEYRALNLGKEISE